MEKFTPEQFKIVAHTLGVSRNLEHGSTLESESTLPEKFYRNYFDYGRTKDCQPDYLESINDYVFKFEKFGCWCFGINGKGIELFRKQFKEEITDNHKPVSKSKQAYQDYLNADIGCTFADYYDIKSPRKVYYCTTLLSQNYDWRKYGCNDESKLRLFINTKYNCVRGEYCLDDKAAKESYKKALSKYKKENGLYPYKKRNA